MARRHTLSVGEFYHLYNRGTERRELFLDEADYDRFMTNLFACNGTNPVHLELQRRETDSLYRTEKGEPLVEIGAFCLMPNHFHILVRERTEGGTSKFMQKLATAYTMYFNKRYERTGGLFQGKFKAEHASEDNYLKYLFSYIHLNPVKLIEPDWRVQGVKNEAEIRNFLRTYWYSSYPDYLGVKREENAILSTEGFPKYFEHSQDFYEQVTSWLKFSAFVEVRP